MSELYQVEEGWIETRTAGKFYFLNPKPEMCNIIDIAHALSLTCRYNGHVLKFYSVAEHSVLMSDWMRGRGYSKRECLTALLHDGAEAYIGDMVRPLKHVMPEFKKIEERIDLAIAERFGSLYPFPNIVKELDSRILVDEREQAMEPTSTNEWGTDSLEPLGVRLKFWSPEDALKNFVGRYQSLTK